jgi:CBS domain-containing protein
MKLISDIMTTKVITVSPQTPIVEAIGVLLQNKFNGLPVIDDKGFLVGIITEYNFIVGSSAVHLPTLIKLFDQLDTYKKDQYLIKNDLKQIITMTVHDVMNKEPLTLLQTDPIEKLVEAFGQHHTVNPIPIVDELRHLVGIVSRSDLLRFFGDNKIEIKHSTEAEIDKSVSVFVENFENRFTFVSKKRTKLWLFVSLLSILIGFAIAWLLILRVNF